MPMDFSLTCTDFENQISSYLLSSGQSADSSLPAARFTVSVSENYSLTQMRAWKLDLAQFILHCNTTNSSATNAKQEA